MRIVRSRKIRAGDDRRCSSRDRESPSPSRPALELLKIASVALGSRATSASTSACCGDDQEPRVARGTGAVPRRLYYPAHVMSIYVPPLRERAEEIPILTTGCSEIRRAVRVPRPIIRPRRCASAETPGRQRPRARDWVSASSCCIGDWIAQGVASGAPSATGRQPVITVDCARAAAERVDRRQRRGLKEIGRRARCRPKRKRCGKCSTASMAPPEAARSSR